MARKWPGGRLELLGSAANPAIAALCPFRLDELGYLPFAQSGGQLLFHLISRPRRRSNNPRSRRFRNPGQLRRRERYYRDLSIKGVTFGL